MREFLKGLGLDQETIDSIMAEHGKVMTATTEKVTELTGKVNELTTENTELKKVDATALQEQITALTAERDGLKETHANELKELQFNNALELAVINSKTVDPVALKAHLDTSKLKYNEETKAIEGIDEQLTGIRESYKYLFTEKSTGGYQGNLGGNNSDTSLGGALKEYYEGGNV